MNNWISCAAAAAAMSMSSAPAFANQNVIKLSSDHANWAIKSGDYAGTRF
jgi:hypothetical protein